MKAGLNRVPLYDNYPFYDLTIAAENKALVARMYFTATTGSTYGRAF